MKQVIKQIVADGFVLFVGLAMFIHSSWSMARIVGGAPPVEIDMMTVNLALDGRNVLVWFLWLLPGILAAASIDIGLIMLANDFRIGKRDWPRLIVFIGLSLISYDMQLSYTLAHSSPIQITSSLSAWSTQAASGVSEVNLWIGPGLLPLVLSLWAFVLRSTAEHVEQPAQVAGNLSPIGDKPPSNETSPIVEVHAPDPLPHSGNGNGEPETEPESAA